MKISLLHATHFRPGGPAGLREEWFKLARKAERIEYLVAVSRSDSLGISQTQENLRKLVDPPVNGSTAVRNWNLLAESATGDLLFVIADDLTPVSEGWDDRLESIALKHDPCKEDYVIKIRDSSSATNTKLRHPVVSRKYFERRGLWNDKFRGMYVDSDFTLRAFWHAAIVDGNHICFNHHHPTQNAEIGETLSFLQANAKEEYDFGRRQLDKTWPKFAQQTRVSLIPPGVTSIQLESLRVRLRELLRMVRQSRLAPSRRRNRNTSLNER